VTDPAGSALDLSRRARGIKTSPTVAVFQKAQALKAQGRRILDFSVGEPDQPTPPHIIAAASQAMAAGKTRYTPTSGIPELRAAIAFRYRKDFRVTFSPEEVLVTNGGKHALYAACQALLNRGDEVIIPSPHWPTFSEAVRLAGARPILVHAQEKDGFQITARMISRATSPRTKAVILNSPSNPTGAVIESEDLLVIGDMAQRRHFTLFYDDTYARLLYGRADVSSLQRLRDSVSDRFVILGTASKSYAMTGWRIGWILGPKALVDAVSAHVSHSTQCPTSFAQYGALEALTASQKGVHEMVAEYKRRRDYAHAMVTSMPLVSCANPQGAFYLFPNVASHLNAGRPTTLDLAERLLEETGIAVVPGEGFAAPGHLRISFARPMEEIREGLERMLTFFSATR
jgi:aspartate aminotransferase